MRQAIITRYAGPTDHRGARVIARCDAGRVTVPWDHAMDTLSNHEAAAFALAVKLKWVHGEIPGPPRGPAALRNAMRMFRRNYRGGGLPEGRGYVFVALD
jgi:hypothetical protein